MGKLDLNNVKIGFIGFGNMAQAMADGFLKTKALRPEQIGACAKDWDKLCSNTQPKGMQPFQTAAETAQWADIVILAVKPYLIEAVTAPILDLLKDRIVISVALGWPFKRFEDILNPGTPHLSTMPNTPVSVGQGVIICETQHSLPDESYALVCELFSRIALIQQVDSAQLHIAGAISGCGPAFTSLFIEALADAAVLHGLPRPTAYKLASQMVAGTGKLQLETGTHPGVMKDAVCSPGGTTILGVVTLERKGLRAAVIDAVDAIMKRD